MMTSLSHALAYCWLKDYLHGINKEAGGRLYAEVSELSCMQMALRADDLADSVQMTCGRHVDDTRPILD